LGLNSLGSIIVMRIFIENMLPQYIALNKLDKYFSSQEKKTYIYTESGIYKIMHNRLMKITIVDKPIKKTQIDDTNIIIDNSYEKIDEEYYQLPFHHYPENITINTYELREKAALKLITEVEDGEIKNIYFFTKGELYTIGIKDDIFSFLSLLKFNNSM